MSADNHSVERTIDIIIANIIKIKQGISKKAFPEESIEQLNTITSYIDDCVQVDVLISSDSGFTRELQMLISSDVTHAAKNIATFVSKAPFNETVAIGFNFEDYVDRITGTRDEIIEGDSISKALIEIKNFIFSRHNRLDILDNVLRLLKPYDFKHFQVQNYNLSNIVADKLTIDVSPEDFQYTHIKEFLSKKVVPPPPKQVEKKVEVKQQEKDKKKHPNDNKFVHHPKNDKRGPRKPPVVEIKDVPKVTTGNDEIMSLVKENLELKAKMVTTQNKGSTDDIIKLNATIASITTDNIKLRSDYDRMVSEKNMYYEKYIEEKAKCLQLETTICELKKTLNK